MAASAEAIVSTCPLCGRPDLPSNMLAVRMEHRAPYWSALHLLCFQCIDAVMVAARGEISAYNEGALSDADFHFGLSDGVDRLDLPGDNDLLVRSPGVSSDGSLDGDAQRNVADAHASDSAAGEASGARADPVLAEISSEGDRKNQNDA